MSLENSNNNKKGRTKAGHRKLILVVVIAVLIGSAIVWALRPRPVPADFATAARGPLQVTIDEEGETRVRDRFVVSAPVAGRVLRIELEPGDEVVAGETVLAVFQPSAPTPLDARTRAEAEARVGAAEAALGLRRAERQKASAQLAYSENEVARYRKLAKEEIVSPERLETAELDLDTRREALEMVDYAVKSAEKDLQVVRAALLAFDEGRSAGAAGEAISLKAPVDGVVLRRLRESESVVPAGEPLIELGDAAELEIVSDLLSTDAVRVRRGNPVLIERWGGPNHLNGVVRRVEPYGFTKVSALGVEEQRVNVIIDFTDPRERWQTLGDGYRVEVRIVIWEGEDVLKIPTSSLFRDGNDWAVFAVADGKAMLRTITLGERNGLEAEVVEGLEDGERVIVHPSDEITSDVAVVERML